MNGISAERFETLFQKEEKKIPPHIPNAEEKTLFRKIRFLLKKRAAFLGCIWTNNDNSSHGYWEIKVQTGDTIEIFKSDVAFFEGHELYRSP